jgi:hypothetical protein
METRRDAHRQQKFRGPTEQKPKEIGTPVDFPAKNSAGSSSANTPLDSGRQPNERDVRWFRSLRSRLSHVLVGKPGRRRAQCPTEEGCATGQDGANLVAAAELA